MDLKRKSATPDLIIEDDIDLLFTQSNLSEEQVAKKIGSGSLVWIYYRHHRTNIDFTAEIQLLSIMKLNVVRTFTMTVLTVSVYRYGFYILIANPEWDY